MNLHRDKLLLDRRGVAEVLGISPRMVSSMLSRGLLPRPLALGRRRLWSRSTLESWIEMGCPSAAVWEERRRAEGSTR